MSSLPSNPHFAFVNVKIGDTSITPIPPQHVEHFSYERSTRSDVGASNKIILTLHDMSAMLLEYEIAKGNRQLEFSYGYVDGICSATYVGQITEYDVDFQASGAVLNIEGISSGLSGIADPKSVTYSDMNIDEIVKKIAEEEGWVVKSDSIEPTAPVYETDDTSLYSLGGSSGNYGNGSDPNQTAPAQGTTTAQINGVEVPAKFTAYYPANNAMEGGFNDCKGYKLQPSRQTCAAPSSVPYASYVWIKDIKGYTQYNNRLYVVTDRGGAINVEGGTYHFDLLFPDASSANEFGVRYGTVIIQNRNYSDTSKGASSGSTTPTTQTASKGKSKKLKTFYRSNMSAPQFINQVLAEYAVSKATGQGGYRLWFDDAVNGGVEGSTVYFKPDQYSNIASSLSDIDQKYKFEWGTGIRSTVKSFNPNFSGILTAVSGGGEVSASLLDKLKNELITYDYDKSTDKNRPTTGDRDVDRSLGKTIIGASSYELSQIKNIAATTWYNNAGQSYPAELVVVGDPTLEPQQSCSIVVLNRDGLPHHSSGVYLIQTVVDDITGGTYESQLSLIRNGLTIGEDESGGLNITVNAIPTTSDSSTDGSYVGTAGGGIAPSDAVEKAVQWAINTANDDSHGYVWGAGGPTNFDCSGFVNNAFHAAGFGIGSGHGPATGGMRAAYQALGFKWITNIDFSSYSQLQRGDILLNEGSHTEIYIGNGQQVGAHSAHKPKADQVSVVSYNNHPWNGILRYGG